MLPFFHFSSALYLMTTFHSKSPEKTLQFAEELGKNAKKGDIFALYGDLGSGKTLLTKGIARGLAIEEDITSPTFTLLEVYKGRLDLYHFDLYRIESTAEFDQLFFEEYWQGDGVSVIEWADRAEGLLPGNRTDIYMTYIDEFTREIQVEHSSI